MAEAPRPNRAAWIVVGLLWVVALLNYFDRQLVTTMGKPLKADLTIGDTEYGLVSSVFLWVYGLCSPLAGYVADRFGKRRVILASLAAWSVATLWTGFVQSFSAMLATRALMGVSESFYIPAGVALIVEYHRGSTRSRATGLHLSGAYAGSVLGGLGGWMAESFGWRTGFRLFGAFGVAYALVLAFLLESPAPDAPGTPGPEPRIGGLPPLRLAETFRALLGTPAFLFLLGTNACVGAAFWTIKNWLPEFFRLELGVDPSRAGIYGATAFNIAALGGMLLAGTLSDRWAARLPRARALVPAVGFCVVAPCVFAVGFATAVPVVIAAVLMAGMGQGSLDANLMPALCTVAQSRYRATGYGLLNFVSTTTGGIMTFVGGWLKDNHVPLGTTFQAASGFILLAGALLFAVRPAPATTPSS